MTFPFESLSAGHRHLGMIVAVLVGLAFGFVLERVGFGRAQKLVAQFYGKDMTVLKVMFSAIVTAMLGLIILSGVQVLELEAVTARYPSFLWPMAVGGLFLGAGFVVSGYCPGTSFVATASGKLDGLVTVVGIVIGSVVYAEAQVAIPALGRFHESSSVGRLSLWQLFDVPPAVLAGLVVVLAVIVLAAADGLERRQGKGVAGDAATRRVVLVSFLLLALGAVSTILVPARTKAQACPAGARAEASRCVAPPAR